MRRWQARELTGCGGATQADIATFYPLYTQQLMWLQEYNCSLAPTSYIGAYVDTSAPAPLSAGVYQISEIEAELRRLLQLASPPVATASNTIYMVHLPAGATVRTAQGVSCTDWFGYHASLNWTLGGQLRVRKHTHTHTHLASLT
jgi:hypothetical protein